MIMSFGVAYVPPLPPVEVGHATIFYLLGNLVLAMGSQGAGFLHGVILPWRRALLFAPAFLLMLPAARVIDGLGPELMTPAWNSSSLVPLLRRKASTFGPGRQS